MLAAIPGDVLADVAVARGNTSSATSVEQGSAAKVNGTKGKPTIATRETPVDHIGKVFFSIGNTNYVCSGNAVSSANQSTVVTAGHCVNEGGAFVTNFAFIPAYDNGSAPYGKWTAKALYAPAQWTGSGDMQYDTGFAVMNQLNGKNLTNVVGGSGVIFNQARGLQYTAYGYPQASPFNGKSLFSCAGKATNDTINPQFNTQGIRCDMTGGSSGGPWFIGSGPDGLQNSINSYGYGGSAVMYGPYWGTVIQEAYFAAAA
jgi:V8-like Glu-specific endopeptidase